ncbi:hypothetical protein AV530_010195 [Patagioenas fasciata monilis]|uniref:Uncharacterized protein n=1 Tax=Patagioenas fasciata monilis TaxID=372326 RepID=A0A1V4JI38_PATFA|nr:hypothetical protein AV530_010195 [Patagioenas fasciata monilis]
MGSWIVGCSFTPNFGGHCSTDPPAAQPEGGSTAWHHGGFCSGSSRHREIRAEETQGLALEGQTDTWTPDRLQEPPLPEDAMRSFWKGEANLVFSGLQIEQVEGAKACKREQFYPDECVHGFRSCHKAAEYSTNLNGEGQAQQNLSIITDRST